MHVRHIRQLHQHVSQSFIFYTRGARRPPPAHRSLSNALSSKHSWTEGLCYRLSSLSLSLSPAAPGARRLRNAACATPPAQRLPQALSTLIDTCHHYVTAPHATPFPGNIPRRETRRALASALSARLGLRASASFSFLCFCGRATTRASRDCTRAHAWVPDVCCAARQRPAALSSAPSAILAWPRSSSPMVPRLSGGPRARPLRASPSTAAARHERRLS